MSKTDREPDRAVGRDPLVAEIELADRWHKSLRTLQRWRAAGRVPPHIRIGSSVFYRFSDVHAFEEARKAGSDDE